MIYYVNVNAPREGNGSKETPFRHIDDAARVAGRLPGIRQSPQRGHGGQAHHLPQRNPPGSGDHRRGGGDRLDAL